MSSNEFTFNPDPFLEFTQWFQKAEQEEGLWFNAMTLSTNGPEGFPSSRIVLLKELKDKQFIFFTNYLSHKGEQLLTDQKVSLCFFWQKNFRQVCIQGMASKVSLETSRNYFHSRPRGSQISALASHQSHELASREVIEKKVSELEKKYEGQEIPHPPHWGGYAITPMSIEFWIGMPSRLHHRVQYTLSKGVWSSILLQP